MTEKFIILTIYHSIFNVSHYPGGHAKWAWHEAVHKQHRFSPLGNPSLWQTFLSILGSQSSMGFFLYISYNKKLTTARCSSMVQTSREAAIFTPRSLGTNKLNWTTLAAYYRLTLSYNIQYSNTADTFLISLVSYIQYTIQYFHINSLKLP